MGGRSGRERDQVAIDLLSGKVPAHRSGAGKQFVAANMSAPKVPAPKLLFGNKQMLTSLSNKPAKPLIPLTAPKTAKIIELPKDPVQVPANTDPIVTAAVAQPEVATAQPATIKRYAIQVGVLPSLKSARNRLAQARPSLKDTGNALRQFTLPLETSSGTHYRARIVGFASMQAAFDACDVMTKNKIECMALVQK